MRQRDAIIKWLTPGLGIKRWLLLLFLGITVLAIGFAQVIVAIYGVRTQPPLLEVITLRFLPIWARVLLTFPISLGSWRYSVAFRSEVRQPLQTVRISLLSF